MNRGDVLKYSVFDIARTYCEEYEKLTAGYNLLDNDNGYGLFSYCIKAIYGIETNEYSTDIHRYSKHCIRELSKLSGVPKRIDKMSFDEKLAVVNVCQGMYASLTVVERGLVKCQSGCQI